jgi:DUF1680 family protein
VEEGTTLGIRAPKPVKLTLKIRIPYWATQGVTIKVNGKAEHIVGTPSTYAELKRKWKDGDKIEVSFPMGLHTVPTPDDSTLQAAMYGPLVLAAQMGREGLTEKMIYGDSGPDDEHQKPIPMPEASAAGGALWFEKVPGDALKFRTIGIQGGAQSVDLKPLHQIMDERYSVYVKVNTKAV